MEDLKKEEIKEEVKEKPIEDEVIANDNGEEMGAEEDTLTSSQEVESSEQQEGTLDDMDLDENGDEELSSSKLEEEVKEGEALEEEIEPEIEQPQEKMLTQSQVNELVGKARQEGRESAMKDLLNRYGVGTEDEMNDIFGRGQAYYDLDNEFQSQGDSLKNVMAENALLKSNIVPERWEDVKLILGGRGLDVSEENISGMLGTHPEWVKAIAQENFEKKEFTPEMGEALVKGVGKSENEQPGTLRKMGNHVNVVPQESEEERVAKLFGL